MDQKLSVKSPNTYQNPGSDRQTVVELLSLSQVLLQNNPDMECLIMLKVCRNCFVPYFYFAKSDILIRTSSDISLNSTSSTTNQPANHQVNHELVGSFVFALIMHHLYNTQLLEHMDAKIECGWGKSYEENLILGFILRSTLQKFCDL